MKIFWLLLLGSFSCSAQQKTAFTGGAGEYGELLSSLENIMVKYQEPWKDTFAGKRRNVFVPWIRDHVHVMKAMKYIDPELTSFIDWFLENQTSEGIYFDYYFPLKYAGSGDRKNIFHKRYWKVFPEDSIEMHRLPVEADLEYLLVEGVYAVWQASGDTAYVRKWLPTLVKGMNYSMTDPLRWSKKYQLLKRGYTLDTWDFMQLPTNRDEYTKNGGNVQKGIFDIDEATPMGIMHGDNSGMYAASGQLSEMFAAVGDEQASTKWKNTARHFRKTTNELCWNGKYYAHFVEDDPMPSYLKMDQRNTLSLSNPYDINRGMPTESMAQSIISTYQQLKESNKDKSFAEWYGIYPAVEPHFADYLPGSYMNGGVNTIVAGELAKAAFQHGFEAYGIDILQRMMDLMKKHNGSLPVAYTPEGKVDEGIPDNWGQAAVYSALIEGLAGVVDKGATFDHVEISPRWIAAGKDSADVSVVYGPSKSQVKYSYRHNPSAKEVHLNMNSPAKKCTVRLLIPQGSSKPTLKVGGKTHPVRIQMVNKSRYAVFEVAGTKQLDVVVKY